jgi:hypothetical protein
MTSYCVCRHRGTSVEGSKLHLRVSSLRCALFFFSHAVAHRPVQAIVLLTLPIRFMNIHVGLLGDLVTNPSLFMPSNDWFYLVDFRIGPLNLHATSAVTE